MFDFESGHPVYNKLQKTTFPLEQHLMALCREPTCSTPHHTTLDYATRRKCVQKFNKDLNAMRTHLFHAIRRHATRRGTTSARSNRPDFLVGVLMRVVTPLCFFSRTAACKRIEPTLAKEIITNSYFDKGI
jgi:hypothetical protein